jgi:(2S)-methylsuccinyl-CoA dehydrogenase
MSMNSPSNTEPLLRDAAALLKRGASVLHSLVAGVGRICTQGGKHLPAELDRWQSETFRIAQLYAQTAAAQSALPAAQLGELEALLALASAGMAANLLREQLPLLAMQIDGADGGAAGAVGADDAGAAGRLAQDERLLNLVRNTAGAAFNARVLEAIDRQQSFGADGLDEERRMLRQSFRAFADKRIKPVAERFHREDLLIPDDLIREAAELGCFGLSIPQAYGGVQDRPDSLGMVLVTEELCRGSLIFGSLITRPEILARALLKGGTERQRARFLPPMASGEQMVAVSVTEPDFGSDVAGIKCSARRTADGWRLNGTKLWCTFAGRAELIGILARSEPDLALGYKGLSLFVIEKPAYRGHDFEHRPPQGGRMAGRAIATQGYRGMHSYELIFEDYPVPAENLIGEEAGRGKGFYLQMEGFAFGRLQTAGRALGLMQAALEAATGYARARQVFGQPLIGYALTQEKLVRMAAMVQTCRQACYAAARRLDEDPAAAQMEASLVKFLACRQAEWITREAQQIHGGMGYAEEFPVSRLFVDARVLSIFEGAEEVLALKVILPALLKAHGA